MCAGVLLAVAWASTQGREGQQGQGWGWGAAMGWAGAVEWVAARPGVPRQLLVVPLGTGCPLPDMALLQGRPRHSMATCPRSSP